MRYLIIEKKGGGAFAQIYLAEDELRPGNPKCAVKQFSPEHQSVQKSDWLQKAIRLWEGEAERLSDAKHPQIPDLLTYYPDDLCIVQEWIEGKNLWDEFVEQRNFSENKIWEILINLLPVIEFIHKGGIFHRDIAPQNIIRRVTDDKLVLVDFGLGYKIQGIYPTPISITSEFGTYVSPERRFNEVSMDLYGLGATCFHLLSGQDPRDLSSACGYNSGGDDYTWTNGWRNYPQSPISQNLFDVMNKLLQGHYQSAEKACQDLPFLENVTTPAPQTWKCTNTLSEHDCVVHSVAISPNGKTLVSGADYGEIKIWNLETEELLYTLPFLDDSPSVKSVAISPDSKTLASSAGTKINLWSLHATESKLSCTIENKLIVNALAFSPDGDYLASGGDEKIKLWLADGERVVHTFCADEGDYLPDWHQPDPDDVPSYSVLCVGFSSNPPMIAAGMWITTPDGETDLGNNIKIWNPCTRKLLYALPGHLPGVRSIAFSPDGKILASGGLDSTVKFWDMNTREEIPTIKEHSGSVCSVAFSPDGQTLASSDGGNDGFIKLWNYHNSKLLQTLKGHGASVNSITFSPDGNTIVSCSSDRTIKIWRCD